MFTEWLTPVLLGALILFTLWGLWRGLSGEIASLLALGSAGVGTWLIHPYILAFIAQWRELSAIYIAVCACLLLILFFLVTRKIVTYTLDKGMSFLIGQPWNAILGGLFGCLKTALATSFIVVLIYRAEDKSTMWQHLADFWTEQGQAVIVLCERLR